MLIAVIAPHNSRNGCKFREFARKQGSQTQAEMTEAWQGEISDVTMGKALRKIGFTRKKNLRVSREIGTEKTRVYRNA